jgi:hypothetical protein
MFVRVAMVTAGLIIVWLAVIGLFMVVLPALMSSMPAHSGV